MQYENSELDMNDEVKNTEGYIETIMLNVLGCSDKNYVIKKIQYFRNNIKDNPEYLKVILDYEQISPILTEKILREYQATQDKGTWLRIYQLFLSQIANLIVLEEYSEAITKYNQLTEALKKYFGITNNENYKNYIKMHKKTSKVKMILPSSNLPA